MMLAGQTVDNIILTPEQNPNIKWSLGKCVIVRNLGVNILVGKPAKKDNKIVTIAHTKTISTVD